MADLRVASQEVRRGVAQRAGAEAVDDADLAQAGGKDATKIDEAVKLAGQIAQERTK